MISLPHFELDGYNILKLQTVFTLLYTDLLQHINNWGKHAQLFFRHYNIIRLPFTICHTIFAA